MKAIFTTLLFVAVSAVNAIESPEDDPVKTVLNRPARQKFDVNRNKRQSQQSQLDWENEVCVCVPYDQCNPNGTLNTQGEGVIDIRVGVADESPTA